MSDKQEVQNLDKNLKVGLVLNTGFTIFEFIIGIMSGSLALISDAGHTHGEPVSDRYCMPKCKGCNQADALCSC